MIGTLINILYFDVQNILRNIKNPQKKLNEDVYQNQKIINFKTFFRQLEKKMKEWVLETTFCQQNC